MNKSKTAQIQFRIDSDLKIELEQKAIKEGLTLPDWLRKHLLEIGGGGKMDNDQATQLIAQLAALQSQQNQNMNQTMVQLIAQITALQTQKQDDPLAQIQKLMELRNSSPIYKAAFNAAFDTPSKCPHCGKEL